MLNRLSDLRMLIDSISIDSAVVAQADSMTDRQTSTICSGS